MGLHPINESTAGKTLITEIVLHRKDTLIVIEVKRNATDARTQVQAQVESLIHEIEKRNETASKVEYIMEIGKMSLSCFSRFIALQEKVKAASSVTTSNI